MSNEINTFLVEMFSSLNPSWINDLIKKNPNKSIEFYVNKCLNKSEQELFSNFEEKEEDKNPEFAEMISLLPG